MVPGICRGMLRNAHDAEDAAQQTFLSAYTSLAGGTMPREPAAWLATIARNECRTRAQRRMREPLPGENLEVAAGGDPAEQAVRSEEVESLRHALARLPGQQRHAFLLREFSGSGTRSWRTSSASAGPPSSRCSSARGSSCASRCARRSRPSRPLR